MNIYKTGQVPQGLFIMKGHLLAMKDRFKRMKMFYTINRKIVSWKVWSLDKDL